MHETSFMSDDELRLIVKRVKACSIIDDRAEGRVNVKADVNDFII